MPSISRKPVIGITTWRRDLPTFLGEKTDLYTLGTEYVQCIEAAGGIPILLAHTNVAEISSYFQFIDGLLISGGGDVDPAHYGQENTGQSYEVCSSGDLFEITLLQEAAKREVPTLGICRGAQIMQVAFGGELLQDLHADYPEHPRTEGDPETILELSHSVHLDPTSQLATIYQRTNLEVNTIHHQCIAKLGTGFKAVGWSADGLIEAVESTTSWFALGVQWHPEKLATESQLFEQLLLQAANRNAKKD